MIGWERDEVAAVEAAILLVSDVTADSYQDDGSYIIAIGSRRADRALARIAAALPPGWRIDWTGTGDGGGGEGFATHDARVWRDDDAEDAADGAYTGKLIEAGGAS